MAGVQPQTPTVSALSYGPEVAAMRGSMGKVLASVSGALYLEDRSGKIAGIVGPAAANGPLTLRVAELEPLKSAQPGADFRWTADMLEVGDVASISFKQSRHWHPELPHYLAPQVERENAAKAVATGASGQHAQLISSVASLVLTNEPDKHSTPDEPAIKALLAHLSLLRLAVQAANLPKATGIVCLMLGLGPGLTPSGDDVIAGIVAALVCRAQLGDYPAYSASIIAREISSAAPQSTNKISARMLVHACEGTLYAPAMELGAALMAGNPDAAYLAASSLSQIGATTGSDLTAGLIFGVLL